MGVYLIYLVFFLGLAMFAYYIFIIATGKRLARLVGSKDRYIWNGLKNISDPAMPFAKKNNTLFLDHDNLVVSNSHVVSILNELRRTDGLDEAVVIPFHRIVSFDYKRSVADWNAVIRVILGLWNRLIKKNDYHLSVRYLDADRTIRQFLFKANSMDVNDFEATFADFDNQIYSGKVRYEAEHGSLDDLVARSPQDSVPPEEDSPTVAIRGGQLPDLIPAQPEQSQTEELPILAAAESDDEADKQTVPPAAPAIAEAELAEMVDEAPAESYAEDDDDYEHSQTIQPVKRPQRNWFEEDYLPRKAKPPVSNQTDAEQTVMISREELMKKDIVFERPERPENQDE